MRTQRSVRIGLAMTGLFATALLPAQAIATTSSAGTDPITSTIKVVATGLNVPRGLVYDEKRQLVFVAEAGNAAGNTGPCAPGEDGLPLCYGPTGSVLKFSEETGLTSRIVSGLPSVSDKGQSFVLGLHDLSLYHGRLSGVFGLLGTPTTRSGLGPGAQALGQSVRFTHSGKMILTGDIASFETLTYGTGEESDPYGLATGRYGTVVANAGGHAVLPDNTGGNDLLLVKHNGTISQLAAFPQRVPAANPKDIVESVPTTVEQGPDGAFYVGELTGFPYYVGEARIWRVVPGHAPTIVASGFTNIIDIAFDHEGRLLVLEIAKNNLINADQTGALIRINRDGSQTTLVSTGLTNPGGVAVVDDHTFYITNNTAGVGGDGQLLRVRIHGDD